MILLHYVHASILHWIWENRFEACLLVPRQLFVPSRVSTRCLEMTTPALLHLEGVVVLMTVEKRLRPHPFLLSFHYDYYCGSKNDAVGKVLYCLLFNEESVCFVRERLTFLNFIVRNQRISRVWMDHFQGSHNSR